MMEYRGTPSFLRVIFPPPGFFLSDVNLSLVVNGQIVLRGSFQQGFDWWAEMQPGWHAIETRIHTGLGFERSKQQRVEVRPALTTIALLEYSRLWGNFSEARVQFVQR